MKVRERDERIWLEDAADFRALALVLDEGAVVPVGPWAVGDDGEHVFIQPEDLARLAGTQADDPDWRGGFDAMVAYATGKGWTGPAGIRMHVERWAGSSTEG